MSMERLPMNGCLIVLLCGLVSSCAFGGPNDHWTLEEEQREKALTEQLNTARPGEREAIQKQLDYLQDGYKYHLDLPEKTSPPQPAPATVDPEKAKAAEETVDKQVEEFNSQSIK
jgi:hypothetical protein